jgi:glycosyltransferase involved in cell wall biosynthesis
MNAPKVSVIVPNFNHAGYLRQRLDSIIRQTFSDFEIILLDDHSTDNSPEVIAEYAGHAKVAAVMVNDTNSGTPFKQWQRGIELARGEWIWIAESDDYADETFLAKMLAAANQSAHVGLIYCDSKIIGPNDSVAVETFATLKNRRFRTDRWNHAHVNSGTDEIERYLLPAGTINNTSAVLFKRSSVSDARIFDTLFRYIGDKYAFIKVMAMADVAYVPEALNYFRNPFNDKHSQKMMFYAYEQFLVFDWVYRNIRISDRERFFEGFYANTRNSLFRGWNVIKFSLYKKMFYRNPYLLLKSIVHNLVEGLLGRARLVQKV